MSNNIRPWGAKLFETLALEDDCQSELIEVNGRIAAMRRRFYIVNEFLLGSNPPSGWREAMDHITRGVDLDAQLDRLRDIWERETNLTGI